MNTTNSPPRLSGRSWTPVRGGIGPLFLILLMCLMTGKAEFAEAGPLDKDIDLAIPRNSKLEDALIAWGRATGVTVMIDTATVDHRVAKELSGTFRASKALALVLEGSGLSYTEDGGRVRVVSASGTLPSLQRESMVWKSSVIDSNSDEQSGMTKSVQSVDESSGRLDEVVVTAEKRVERLQDVPVPVTVVSSEALVESNEVRLEDFYTKVPGLSFTEGYAGFPNVSIRGLTTSTLTNPTVSVVVDDVPYGSSTAEGGGFLMPDIDPNDLARVEVLRGPQGTLYGASSLGGLIKYVTVDPDLHSFSGRISAGGDEVHNGSDLGYSTRGYVNVPLDDTLAVRASAFVRRDPGYIDAPNFLLDPTQGGIGINGTYADGGRVALLWNAAPNLSVRFSALAQDNRIRGSQDVETGPGIGQFQQLGLLKGTGEHDTKSQVYSLTTKWNIGNANLTSVSAFGTNTFSNINDLTNSFYGGFAQQNFAVGGVADYERRKTNKGTEELRLSTPLGRQLDLLVGLFYTHEASSGVGIPLAVDPVTLASAGSIFVDTYPTTYEEYSLFSDLTWKITDDFDVQFGGRESQNRQFYSETVTGVFAALVLGANPYIIDAIHSRENAFTYLVTPEYKFSPDVLTYMRFASGYRPGGPNNFPVEGEPLTFKDDTTRNYEIGIKGSALNHTLSFDASLYYIDWKDMQLQVTNQELEAQYYTNASRAKSQGLELSVDSSPWSGFSISGWVVFAEAELTQALPNTAVLAGAYGVPGDPLPYSSRFSGNVSLDEKFSLWNGVKGTVGISESYIGARNGDFVGAPSTPRAVFPAYAQMDVKAGVKVQSWSMNIYADNLLDKRGILSLDLTRQDSYVFTRPRTIGFLATKEF